MQILGNTGDQVNIYGNYFSIPEESDPKSIVYRPAINLRTGKMELSGKVDVKDFIDFYVKYKIDLFQKLDPEKESIFIKIGNIDLDFSSNIDWLVRLGGVIPATILNFKAKEKKDELLSQAKDFTDIDLLKLSDFIPFNDKVHTFFESIFISPEGILINAQVEAGCLHCAGRKLNPPLDLGVSTKNIITYNPFRQEAILESEKRQTSQWNPLCWFS